MLACLCACECACECVCKDCFQDHESGFIECKDTYFCVCVLVCARVRETFCLCKDFVQLSKTRLLMMREGSCACTHTYACASACSCLYMCAFD